MPKRIIMCLFVLLNVVRVAVCVCVCAQLEYFMIQCLKQKAKERPDKRRGYRMNEPRPPHLDQPGNRLPDLSFCSLYSQDYGSKYLP